MTARVGGESCASAIEEAPDNTEKIDRDGTEDNDIMFGLLNRVWHGSQRNRCKDSYNFYLSTSSEEVAMAFEEYANSMS